MVVVAYLKECPCSLFNKLRISTNINHRIFRAEKNSLTKVSDRGISLNDLITLMVDQEVSVPDRCLNQVKRYTVQDRLLTAQ